MISKLLPTNLYKMLNVGLPNNLTLPRVDLTGETIYFVSGETKHSQHMDLTAISTTLLFISSAT